MAASGSTPIALYYSPTASAVPVNTNLVNGELALNTTDEKLYFKNAAGTVKLLASNAASTPVTTFSGGTTGLTPASATSGAVTLAGTLAVANGGTGVTSSTGSGSNVLSVSPTLTGTTLVSALRLTGATSGYVGLSPAAVAGSTTYTLPAADGTAGQVLQTSGAAVLSWVSTSALTNFTSGVNTTAPNATVPYVSLTATNAATNVDVAIVPKGAGAFSLQVADNAATGGNKRGGYAVDLQLQRNAATQVASAIGSFTAGRNSTASSTGAVAIGDSNIASNSYALAMGISSTASGANAIAIGRTTSATVGDAVIIGGYNHTVAAIYGSILGGASNTINLGGNYSAIVGGNNNTIGFLIGNNSTILGGSNNYTGSNSYANIIGGAYGAANSLNSGVTVFPAIGLSSGVRQFITTTLYVDTTTATATNLTYDGTNTGIAIPNNSAVYFKGTVIAGVTAKGNTKGWTIEGVLKGTSGTFVGTPTVTSSYADAGASAWTVALSTTSTGMTITVTGAAGVTIRWVANVQMTMMGY